MKLIFTNRSKTVLLFFIIYLSSHAVSAATLTTVVLHDTSYKTLSYDTITRKEKFLLLTSAANNFSIAKYQRLSGKKLSLKNKVRYLFIKHELKPKGQHKSMLPSFEGFVLGLCLGPIGVLIAYLSSKNKQLRHGAIAGGVISILLFILLLALASVALEGISFDFFSGII